MRRQRDIMLFYPAKTPYNALRHTPDVLKIHKDAIQFIATYDICHIKHMTFVTIQAFWIVL